MRIRWQLNAVSDLANIRDYIAEHDPAAARSVVERVIGSVSRLNRFPESGRNVMSLLVTGDSTLGIPS